MSANVRTLERAIRAKCLDCSGGMRNEVRDCRIKNCALWPYRGAGAAETEASSGAARHLPLKGKAMGEAELVGQMEIGDVLEACV